MKAPCQPRGFFGYNKNYTVPKFHGLISSMEFKTHFSIRHLANLFDLQGQGLFVPATIIEGALSHPAHVSNWKLNQALQNAHPELFHLSHDSIFQCWHKLPQSAMIAEMRKSTKTLTVEGFYETAGADYPLHGIILPITGEDEMLVEAPFHKEMLTISHNCAVFRFGSPLRVRDGSKVGALVTGVVRVSFPNGKIRFAAFVNGELKGTDSQYKRANRLTK